MSGCHFPGRVTFWSEVGQVPETPVLNCTLDGEAYEWSHRSHRLRSRRGDAPGATPLARFAEDLGPVNLVGAGRVADFGGAQFPVAGAHQVRAVPRAVNPALQHGADGAVWGAGGDVLANRCPAETRTGSTIADGTAI